MSDKPTEDIDLAKMFNISTPAKLDFADPILVVEDQTDMRLIVVHQLQKLGFNKIKQSDNGYQALETMGVEKNIAAIICDKEMPVMGGMDLLQELRERTDLVRPPFCLAMDHVNKEKLMFAIENGCDEVLVKPFTLADIAPKVHAAFKVFHNPKNPEKVYELAKAHMRAGKLDEAAKVYEALKASAAKSARPLVGLARVAHAKKDTEGALKYLQEAEQRNPNFVHLFALRGDILAQSGRLADALVAYQEGIKLSPLNPIRYKAAAEILFKEKNYKEGVDLLEGAVKQGLEFKELYNFISQGCFALKEFSRAIRYIKSALNADPENVTYLNQLGICLKETQNFDEATKVYNQVIKLDPDNIPALYNKAVLANSKGQTEEAIKLLERVLKKDPNFAVAKLKLEEYRKATAPKKAS